ncbi:hypothetical protein NAT51_13765 [Flavobacterium amniphilum]|uniref:hypothetical protein n=1 Tax=Flavobacterium amniphilum TaxID=1834035 RepID=UPI00202A3899|nr:hypothetical protein [Flavobacterium amniphilum]MCL9806598.1 hypothetical protein [Flavobacterium amniphilum]
MDEAKNYLQDIKDIKQMMSQSSQFISLSGLSGVLAGIYAILGGLYVNQLIFNHGRGYITFESETFRNIFLTAVIVLLASLVTAYIMTARKAKRMGEKIWNPTSRRLLINFAIPLFSGGILAMLLIRKEYYALIGPMTLLFYGLACLNASKYTLRDVRYLGITEIILGLLAVEFSGFGLYFWMIGFGLCHIVYGTIMYLKYDRK